MAIWATAAQVAHEAQADSFPKSPTVTLTGIPFPINVATGDLFNDGKPALLVSSWARVPAAAEQFDQDQSRVLIFRQKDGKYQLPADREFAVKSPFGMAVGDFDNDGISDLALSPYGTFDLRLGKENLVTPHLCPTPNGGAGQVLAVKLNQDGFRDFLSGPVWRKWSGADQWQQGYICGPKINDNKLAQIADLDDDGQPDLIFLPVAGKELRLYYGPFLNMMVAAEELSKFALLSAPLAPACVGVGDFNGDSRPDIIASTPYHAEADQRKTFIWHQNSPTGFTDHALPSETIAGICGQFAVADVNQDGRDDLLVAAAGDGKLYIFLQKPDQPLATNPQAADETILAGTTQTLCVADLNGDGYPDIIHDDASQIRVYFNKGLPLKPLE